MLYKTLKSLNISYKKHSHEAVYTVKQAKKYYNVIPGTHCKNLFLRNKKGNQHYLVILEHDKDISIKEIGETLNEKLSFASEKRLEKYLMLAPGSVSPFGLINDLDNHVIVLYDKRLENSKKINFHPNINTFTLTVSFKDFIKFLNNSGNIIRAVEL